VIDSATRCTDLFVGARRRSPIALSAEMQWELLPPSCIAGPAITIAGRLEPAYEVAGDCFDYALNDDTAHVGIFDPLGHDLGSTLLATLAVGAYRHGRRSNTPLAQIGSLIDDTVRRQFDRTGFLTGQLAELDVVSGALTWTNAGHPLPLLLRDRQVHTLELRPDPPWGLGQGACTVDQVDLQPGDHVLFYTDGIVEARSADGEEFGVEHLADLLVRESLAEFAAPELLRRILQAVMDHRADHLADDATAVIVSWRGNGEPAELGG
jgi:serine phosphatase RsbU (regulator of sigma subunit)